MLITYPLFTNNLPILISSLLLIICQSFTNLLPMDYQLFTNAIFLLLSLPIVYQSFANQPHLFYYIGDIVAETTNYSNLMHQCFINHYQSERMFYISSLPITRKINCQYIITNHSIGNFILIGSQCFTNYQFTNGIWKFTNSCQWFTIGSYWQWYALSHQAWPTNRYKLGQKLFWNSLNNLVDWC